MIDLLNIYFCKKKMYDIEKNECNIFKEEKIFIYILFLFFKCFIYWWKIIEIRLGKILKKEYFIN